MTSECKSRISTPLDRPPLRVAGQRQTDYADHQWLFADEPFINELCLVLIVALRHQIERELVWIAARVTEDRRELTGDEYSQRIRDLQCKVRSKPQKEWKDIEERLSLRDLDHWGSVLKTLRLLANAYKHSPWATPDPELVKHLQGVLQGRSPDLSQVRTFAPMSESQVLIKALAASLGLTDTAGYCEIAEELLTRADHFLSAVEANSRLRLSPVKRRPASSNPDDFEQ